MSSCKLSHDKMNVPFPEKIWQDDAESESESESHLAGHPWVLLSKERQLLDFLQKDLCTPILEEMSPRLWIMATQSSSNISALHHQKVKGRDIVITENPELHLVWYYDRIFIKPLPKYLLSHRFWMEHLVQQSSWGHPQTIGILKSAKGLLRTYRHLIKYESDFQIAIEKQLLPSSMSWEDFCHFARDLDQIQDEEVSGRYAYGELRLSRLNFYIKIFLHRSQFHSVHGQYHSYFSRFYTPLFFCFGLVSLILNALQVELAVEPLVSYQWPWVWTVSRGFGVFIIIATLIISVAIGIRFLWMVGDEWVFALRMRRRKKTKMSIRDCR